MRVAGDVYVEWVGGEAVVLDRGSGELHYLNPPAAAVLALIQEHGFDEGLAQTVARFGLDPEDAELHALIRELADSGILLGEDRKAPPAVAPSVGEPRAAAG